MTVEAKKRCGEENEAETRLRKRRMYVEAAQVDG